MTENCYRIVHAYADAGARYYAGNLPPYESFTSVRSQAWTCTTRKEARERAKVLHQRGYVVKIEVASD